MTVKKEVFVSHSTKDDARVDHIADMLEAVGFEVWVDHRNGIEPGTPSWDAAIRRAIAEADAALFVMSEAALASEICGSECLLVRELSTPLYVLKLEEVASVNVWLYIKQIQYADLAKDFDAGMNALIKTLKGEKVAGAPQALHSQFTGENILRRYLPFLFVSPMRGRDDDLKRLTESLNGVVQVTGTGGLGKSRLVAEVALKHPEGAVWYRCSPVSSVADLLGALIEHLRLKNDSSEREVLEGLRRRPKTLIVIDNAEDVPPARRADYLDLIAKLQAARAHIVLTSRVRWEELKPSREITPTALNETVAAVIASDFAEAQGIPLSEREAQELAVAARLYPRLIEWAVGQLAKRPLAQVMAQLKDLKSKGVQEALEEMIGKSLQQMSHDEGDAGERLLRRLVVFQGTFDYAALQALKPDDMDDAALDAALDVLQAWRFVRYDRSEERYNVDEMVRLALPAPDADAQARHFAHYVGLYGDDEANQTFAGDGTIPQHARIAQDWENVQAGLAWGLAHASQEAVDWVLALDVFMFLRRTSQERQDLLEKALQVAQATTYTRGEANCLRALGEVHRLKGEYGDAVDHYQEALA
ncbi:MAG: TIR domain-containing protein, partial [Aggregatilineales bacterium]